MKYEDAPTKKEMWEQIIKLTDQTIDYAWRAGYNAGVQASRDESMEEISLEGIE